MLSQKLWPLRHFWSLNFIKMNSSESFVTVASGARSRLSMAMRQVHFQNKAL
jgi:hypothetical protein